jgi:hypothetical protein
LSESKKVQDFLTGIEDTSFSTFKGIVLGDNDKLESFEQCQQYLKTCSNVLHTTQTAGNKRNIATTVTSRIKKGKKVKSPGSPDDPPHYGHYSNEEYKALNMKQRMKLKQYREANRKGKLGGKRKTAVVDTAKSDTESDDEVPPRKAKKVKMTEPRPRSIIKAVKTNTAVIDDDHDGGAWITVEKVTKKYKAEKRRVNNELEAQAVPNKVSKQDEAEKRRVESKRRKQLNAEAQFGRSSNSKGEKEAKRMKV